MLPGLAPMSVGSSKVWSPTVLSATSSGTSITIPATAQAGDLAVMFDHSFTAFAGAPAVTPSGWTNLLNYNYASVRIMAHARLLSEGQAGTSVGGMSGAKYVRKIMLVLRPKRAIQGFTGSPITTQAAIGNTPMAVADYSGISGGSVTFGVLAESNYGINSPSFTPTPTGGLGTGGALHVFYLLHEGSGELVSLDQGPPPGGGIYQINQLFNLKV